MMLPRKWIISLSLCVCVIALFAHAGTLFRAHEVTWDARRVNYVFDGTSFESLDALRRQLALDKHGEVSGWGQKTSVSAVSPVSRATSEVDAVYIDGNAALVVNTPMVTGQLPVKGDNIGCAIDEKTAMLVFGSTNILNLPIEIDEVRMEVRGVFRMADERGLALCPAALAGEDTKMDALSFLLFPSGAETAAEQADALIQTSNLSGAQANDHKFERALLDWLQAVASGIWIPAVFGTLMYALTLILKRHVSESVVWFIRAAYWMSLVALFMRVLLTAPPPMSMLPTRWSNFAFWPELFSRWRASWESLLLNGTGRINLTELLSIAKILGLYTLSILATLCAWSALHILTNTQFKGGNTQ